MPYRDFVIQYQYIYLEREFAKFERNQIDNLVIRYKEKEKINYFVKYRLYMYGKCKKNNNKLKKKKFWYGNIVTDLQSDFGCIERKRDHVG